MADWLDVSATATRIAYTATSGQTAFAVPFTFADEAHLAVYQNDTLKTLSTHYVTSGAGDTAGGYVTLVTGATLDDSIVIELVVPYELTTHIPTSGTLDIPAVNLQNALLVMMLKQLAANLPRSLRQPASDADDLDEMPTAANRASKYLFCDADGQPTFVASISTAVAATAFAQTLLDDADAAAARATLGIVETEAPIGIQNYLFFQ
jgi:hypothetical protein